MTTIFIENLKTLALEVIKERWAELHDQAKKHRLLGFTVRKGYNKKLSITQADILSDLEANIQTFVGTGNDSEDKDAIKGLISAAKESITAAREGQSKDGQTLPCLVNLLAAIDHFYERFKTFSSALTKSVSNKRFSLVDCPYSKTPEYIVYFQSGYYLGRPIFDSDIKNNINIRTKKEQALLGMLTLLNEAIHLDHNLATQKGITERLLEENLRLQNDRIVSPSHASSIPGFQISSISLFSATVKTGGADSGDLDSLITQSLRKINALTEQNSDCPKEGLSLVKERSSDVPNPGQAHIDEVKDEGYGYFNR